MQENFSFEDPSEMVCPYFVQGNCRFGANCWFKHPAGQPRAPQEAECSICFQPVRASGMQFGLLLGCTHLFCLPCIRQWRGQLNVSKEISKACPLCRIPSHYVLPSDEPVTSYDEKLHMSESYKKRLATIPCAKFNFGDGECPFGSSCFYDHRYRDGTPWVAPKPQFVLDEDGVWRVLKPPKLCDFINI